MAKKVDSNIGSLPKATYLADDSLLVAEQQGEALAVPGELFIQFARESVTGYVGSAEEQAQAAKNHADSAKGHAESSYGYAKLAQSAKEAIEDMSVAAVSVSSDSNASVKKQVQSDGSVKLTFSIPEGEKGDQGDPGYTPRKNVDYFDGKDGYTPQKNIDYFDGKDGYTPQKGIDYFDGDKGDPGYSGVYVGADTPPDNANVWINPNGKPTGTENWEFELDTGATDTKMVVVIGSDTANGTLAMLRFKQGDKWVEIPAITGTDGKTAYQYAVEGGYVGSEEQFTAQLGAASSFLNEANGYTDAKIAELINGAPTTLDTLGEIATAMAENADVVEALNGAIGSKADADTVTALTETVASKANNSDLTAHAENKSNPHGVTAAQLGAAESVHSQAASTITAGTFGGQVVANAAGQAPSVSVIRNSKVVLADENPTVEGEIVWVCK